MPSEQSDSIDDDVVVTLTVDERAVDDGLCGAIIALRNLPEVGDAVDQAVAGAQRVLDGARSVLYGRGPIR